MKFKTVSELEITYLYDEEFNGFLFSSINLEAPIALESLDIWVIKILEFCKVEKKEEEIKEFLPYDKGLNEKILELNEIGLLIDIETNPNAFYYDNWIQNDSVDFLDYSYESVFEEDKLDMRNFNLSEQPPSPQNLIKGYKVKLLHPANFRGSGSVDASINSSVLSQPITYKTFASILFYGIGVLRKAKFHQQLPVVLKTYPSNGARHEFEFYIEVRGYSWLQDGLYHYEANNHCLVLIEKNSVSTYIEKKIRFYCSVVYERVQWRYRNSWNLRDIYMDYGHFKQHFKQLLNSYRIKYHIEDNAGADIKCRQEFLEEEIISYIEI